MPAPLAPLWFKSSYSGGSGTECVECACTSELTLVRDSKAQTGPIVTVRTQAWQLFIRHLSQQVWGN